ncbi:H-NS histone family protein [Comamonas thiooxydans]|uniref:H-NS histone family protein n=1 Tax=Comamonas thiooxydans TaxID=363952 RepID=UPI000B421B56|nr:H-NS histone family protein [Comamonas thiooxydans]
MSTPESKSNLQSLLEQQAQLNKQIEEQRRAEKVAVIAEVRKTVADFGLTAEDVFAAGKPRKKAAVKYKDPVSGATWSGRGRNPKWFDPSKADAYAV